MIWQLLNYKRKIYALRNFLFLLILLFSFACNNSLPEGKYISAVNPAVAKRNFQWKSSRCDSIKIIPTGKIKSIISNTYAEPADSLGMIVKGKLFYINRKEYDSTGNILFETAPYDFKKNYFYENGKLIREQDSILNRDDPYTKIDCYLYTYDKNGNCIKDTWIFRYGKGKPGRIDSKSTYDKNNNRVEYREIQHPSWWTKYEYDSLNQMTKEITSDGGKIRWREYSYNQDGKKTGERIFEKDSCTSIYKTSYFLSGMIKEDSVFDKRGMMIEEHLYYYDRYGNELYSEMVQFEEPGLSIVSDKKWETDLIYDKNGNWIRKDIFLNGKLWRVEERVIGYY